MSIEPARRRPSPWPPIMFVCFILVASAAFYALLREPAVKIRPRFTPDALVFAADGSALALSGRSDLELYSVPDYQRVAHIEASLDIPHETAVAWSANLSHVALSAGSGTSIEIRDARKDRYFRSLPSDAPGMIVLEEFANGSRGTFGSELVAQLAWSPDSRYLAILRYSGAVQVWDLQTNATISVASDVFIHESCLAWSADSQSLIFRGRTGGQLSIYRAPDFSAAGTLETRVRCSQIALHPNGALLAQAGDSMDHLIASRVEVWHLGTMLRTASYGTPVDSMAWHPTEEVLAILARNRLELWRPFDDEVVVLVEDEDDRITAFAFSPDGRQLLLATDDQQVRALDLAERAPTLFP